MSPVALLVLGVPIALAVELAIRRLTWQTELADYGAHRRLLAWQVDPGALVLRAAFAGCVPLLLAVAGTRFDGVELVVVIVILTSYWICAATDLLCYRVPLVVIAPAGLVALLAAFALPSGSALDAVLGALLGAALFLPPAVLSAGRFGFADANFAIFIGASLGLSRAFDALVLGILLAGAIIALLLVARVVRRGQVTPYAPALALTAIGVALTRGTAFAPI